MLLEKLGARRGRAHLEAMLRRWSHKTLILHARNAGKFLEWASRCTEFRDEDPENAAVLKLVSYMQFLRGAGAAPTVPRARLASIAFYAAAADLKAHG